MSNGDSAGATRLTRRDTDELFSRSTGSLHTFQLRRLHAFFLEVEDLHFNHDSAVLLADYRDTAAADDDASPDAQDDASEKRITAIAVLAAAYRHAEEHPDQKIVVPGHTDRSGPDAYNLALSLKRAKNVLHLLKGEKDKWVQSCLGHHKTEDHQQLLKWMFEDHAWDTDPGAIDNSPGPLTRGATRRFKERFNTEFGASIPVNESFDAAAWGAFFDVYMRELREVMLISEVDLALRQSTLSFLDPGGQEAVGCGENWPITDQHRSRVDRRVEIVFFDPGEEPFVPLRCHPSETQCVKAQCELRNPGRYTLDPIPVEPVLPARFRVAVHLVMVWKDPAGLDHPFPKDMVVKVKTGDGVSEDHAIGENGRLAFNLDKRKNSFTLGFEHAEASYIATAPADFSGSDAERLVARPDVPALLGQGFRVFLLPPSWNLDDCDWNVDAAAAPTFRKPDFADLPTLRTIGTPGSPCRVQLDPHWQFLKLLYFDRKLKQELSILPAVLEGFAQASASSGDPDTQSNWTTHPQACQCLPWMKRRAADGSVLSKPDGQVLLQLRCQPGTFIDSSAATAGGGGRKLVTKNAAPPGADPGLNGGENTTTDFDVPNAARLAFYDLPSVWKSRTYFARLSPTRAGQYETVAADPTSDAAPVMFRLDDIVLTDAALTPIAWQPNHDPKNNRPNLRNGFAIFCNTFAKSGPSSAQLSPLGLFKPDTANNESFFSERPSVENNRNYIADYPQWTRVVITQGNIFDCFDKRTPDGATGVVGARAGVRWVNSAAIGAPGTNIGQQSATVQPFCTVQPFFNQAHHAWWTNNPTLTRNTGRFDLVLLRCCDVETDGTTESAMAMSYIRLAFNFNPPANPKPRNPAIGPDNPPEFNPGAVPLNPAAAVATKWVDDALRTIPLRWTGPEGTHNPTAAAIVSRAGAGGPALRAKYMFFGQSLPRGDAHFELGVFRNPPPTGGGAALPVRAYMGSDVGYGTLDQGDNQSTAFFTAAHEIGHGISLGDEYIEQVHTPGTPPPNGPYPTPWVLSFDSNQPGGPYQPDEVNTAIPGAAGMMNGNDQVRGRYFWHVAEWMRVNLNSPFDVSHNNKTYTLPAITQSNVALASPTADRFTLVNWPLRQTPGVTRAGSPHVRHDVFLYKLGRDDYADVRLPGAVQGVASPPPATVAAFDAIMTTIVRMAFSFPGGTTNAQIHTWLQRIDAGILSTYCFRWKAAGNAGSALSRVLMHFSARYRAPGYSPNPLTNAITPHITVSVVASGAPGWTGATTFRTNRTNAGATALINAFADMIGLTGANNVAGSYTTLAGEVLGGATVSQASV